MTQRRLWMGVLAWFLITRTVMAGVGDPQVRTNHIWYPGELACSTFERLEATQAMLYKHVVGETPATDAERVLAAWLWRNTHYWHGAQGVEDLWDRGFDNHTDSATRDYWTGLFAHGFGLCGTTHAQWTAEFQALLGHNRARCVGVTGHNSFEVLLTGGPYGNGRWVLLDHDLSTVIFDDTGKRLLSIDEIRKDVGRFTRQQTSAEKQNGWLVSGLHPDDGGAFDTYRTAEYLAGYAGPPPMIYLRRGETLRRYLKPGLGDSQTYVFWGRNYGTGGIPGPERSRTWVNQPEKMYRSRDGTGHHDGQARFANAVYTYAPDFSNGDYRESCVDETDSHVVLEFHSPYIIGATPPNDEPWGVYLPGCRNGLIVSGTGNVPAAVSVDRGRSWHDGGTVNGKLDLTDSVKGHRQYWIRFGRGAERLVASGLRMVTVCQCNSSIIPQLTDQGSVVTFEASGRAVASAGPNRAQAEAQLVEGAFGSPRVTMQLSAPRGAIAVEVYAAAHVQSSNPPSPDVTYSLDVATPPHERWRPLVDDWRITRRGDEPADFWSQSFCWGSATLDNVTGPLRVRFYNDGGKHYRRAEMHVVYRVPNSDRTKVTFCWLDDRGPHQSSHVFDADPGVAQSWRVATGSGVQTQWVEYSPTE